MPAMQPKVLAEITNIGPPEEPRKSFLDTCHKATKRRPPSLQLEGNTSPVDAETSGFVSIANTNGMSTPLEIFEDSSSMNGSTPDAMSSGSQGSINSRSSAFGSSWPPVVGGEGTPITPSSTSPATPANRIVSVVNQNGIYIPPNAPMRPSHSHGSSGSSWGSQSSTPQSPSPFGWTGYSPSAGGAGTPKGGAQRLFSSPCGTPVTNSSAGMVRPSYPMPITPVGGAINRKMSFGSLPQPGMVMTPLAQPNRPDFPSATEAPPAPQKVLPQALHSPVTPVPMSISWSS